MVAFMIMTLLITTTRKLTLFGTNLLIMVLLLITLIIITLITIV
jgi:hypothetical protein